MEQADIIVAKAPRKLSNPLYRMMFLPLEVFKINNIDVQEIPRQAFFISSLIQQGQADFGSAKMSIEHGIVEEINKKKIVIPKFEMKEGFRYPFDHPDRPMNVKIAERIVDGEEVSPLKEDLTLYSTAVFTKGACIDPFKPKSPVHIGSIATLLDHTGISPCAFFRPHMVPFTRVLTIEYFPKAHDSIMEGEQLLCACKVTKMQGRKIECEIIMHQRGIPYARGVFFGISVNLASQDAKEALKAMIDNSETAKPMNFGAMSTFADATLDANGDSVAIIDMNSKKQFGLIDDVLTKYAEDIMKSSHGNIIIISGTGINGGRPIGGYPACIFHRVFFNKETGKYSAGLCFSEYAEGPPYRAHGGGIAESFIQVMTDAIEHLISTENKIKRENIKVRKISVEYLNSVRMNEVVVIPEIILALDNEKGDVFDVKMDFTQSGSVTNKLLEGKVDICQEHQSNL